MPAVVTVTDLGKRFHRYRTDRPKTFKEAMFGGLGHIRPLDTFWALRNINLDVQPGKALGIIGANGAGKSTLLQLIGGIGCPDEGKVSVNGRIGSLFSPSSGLTSELNGRENIYILGVIAGLTRKQISQRFDSIVNFAELEEYIDSPLRTYSSGMRTRLGFAVTIHTDPNVLLIDEALSVGDIKFQAKCINRIIQFKNEGCAILLVSHSAAQIKDFCEEALWLCRGEPKALGSSENVVESYITNANISAPPPINARSSKAGGNPDNRNDIRGRSEIEIVSVNLFNDLHVPVDQLNSGEALEVEIKYNAHNPVKSPIFIVSIRHEDKSICCIANSTESNIQLDVLDKDGVLTLRFKRLDLVGGKYIIDVGIHERSYAFVYDYLINPSPLIIRPTGGKRGVLYPPVDWKVKE